MDHTGDTTESEELEDSPNAKRQSKYPVGRYVGHKTESNDNSTVSVYDSSDGEGTGNREVGGWGMSGQYELR